jgi:hypothetical protein
VLPAWPRHEALLRFDLPLFVLKRNLLLKNEWASRFVVLRGSCLYYSDGKSGHPDSLEGSLAFMRSNPAPDGHFCFDLKGACARCATAVFCRASQSFLDAGCSVAAGSAAVDGQAFAFEIKFPADRRTHKDLCLAAADDVTRQRCLRIIEAASSSWASPPDIASSAALTPGLFMMRSVPAANAVLAALGRPAVKALDLPSLDVAGWHVDVPLLLEFGYDAVAAAGVDFTFFKALRGREKDLRSCILVSFLLCSCTRALELTSPPPSPIPLQRDGSNLYMTLHVLKVDDRTKVRNGDTPVHAPFGWPIAPGDADDARVCGAHPWQSNVLVFSNGDAYGTAMQSSSSHAGATLNPSKNLIFSRLKIGKKMRSGYLIQDEQGARAEYDDSEVLLRRRA